MLKKRLCVIYANCQGRAIGHFLNKSNDYHNGFKTVFIDNYLAIANKKSIDINLLPQTDIFIYQPLSDRYKKFSSNFLKTLLPSSCKIISFPYIYNDALWPMFPNEGGKTIVGHEPVTAMIDAGYDLREIVSRFLSLSIDFGFQQRFTRTINILRSKEAHTDIKVSDYIINNIKKRKLFLTQNHPTSTLILYVVKQILSRLHFDPLQKDNAIHPNEANLPNCWPVSPYERNHYGWDYDYDWKTFYEIKKDGNWQNFYLKLIGEIYFRHSSANAFKTYCNKIFLRLVRELSKTSFYPTM